MNTTKSATTKKRAAPAQPAQPKPSTAKRRRSDRVAQRHVQEVLNTMANAHANKPAATLKNMPPDVLAQIASGLTKPSNLAQLAATSRTGLGEVAKKALRKQRNTKTEDIELQYAEIVNFFKPRVCGVSKANAELVSYMARVPGMSLDHYTEYLASRYAIHVPENDVDGEVHHHITQVNGTIKVLFLILKKVKLPFRSSMLMYTIAFDRRRGLTRRDIEIRLQTPDFLPVVTISDTDERPAQTRTVARETPLKVKIQQVLPDGIRVVVELVKTSEVFSPMFYVRRYSILGETWWRHARGNAYDRIPPPHAYPMKALHYVIKKTFGTEKAIAYKDVMRQITAIPQNTAARIIQKKWAHVPFNARIKTILERRNPQILTNADVRALAQYQNNAMKKLIGPRLDKNAREGSGNAFRRRVFSVSS